MQSNLQNPWPMTQTQTQTHDMEEQRQPTYPRAIIRQKCREQRLFENSFAPAAPPRAAPPCPPPPRPAQPRLPKSTLGVSAPQTVLLEKYLRNVDWTETIREITQRDKLDYSEVEQARIAESLIRWTQRLAIQAEQEKDRRSPSRRALKEHQRQTQISREQSLKERLRRSLRSVVPASSSAAEEPQGNMKEFFSKLKELNTMAKNMHGPNDQQLALLHRDIPSVMAPSPAPPGGMQMSLPAEYSDEVPLQPQPPGEEPHQIMGHDGEHGPSCPADCILTVL
jgi:hypothetical protein